MKIKPTILVTSSALFFSLFCLCFAVYSFSQNTPPRTFLLQKDYSFLDSVSAKRILSSHFSLPSQLVLNSPSTEIIIHTASISAVINYSATIDQLFFHFRSGQSLWPQIKNLFSIKNHQLIIDYDSDLLDTQIATISAKLNKPFIPTELQLSSSVAPKQITVLPGNLGLEVDTIHLRRDILQHLGSLDTSAIPISLRSVGRLPSPSQLAQNQARAQKLINKTLFFNGDFDHVPIDAITLISWIDFYTDFNQPKIEQFSQGLAQSLHRDPVNAIFKFENDQVVEFRPAKDGLEIATDSLISSLPSLINQLMATSSASLSFPLPVKNTPPLVQTQDVNTLGINQLLGRGTSTFKHSASIRNHNIQKGASIINHVLVSPGKTFSFLEALGEVTLEQGYKKAYIIRQGKTELDVGGGICQVSTTFFRAMLDSGVEILERRPHAFRVSYYEEDRDPGYDATVFIPSPDLRFKNDTPAHILIQSTYDGVNKILTYDFYGTSDDRQVLIDNYKKWGWQAAPPTRYIDDPTLPPGELVREEYAVAGIKTSFDWIVTRQRETLNQQTFSSSYVPWAAVFRRGI